MRAGTGVGVKKGLDFRSDTAQPTHKGKQNNAKEGTRRNVKKYNKYIKTVINLTYHQQSV